MFTSARLVCIALVGLACGCARSVEWGHYQRGMDLISRGEYEKAVPELETCVRLDAKEPEFTNRLAWILATCPRETIRNGERAVSLATRACEATRWVHPFRLDTLAAAYAEAGKFEEAAKWQEKAMAQLPDDRYRSMYQARLDLYKDGKPYREGFGL